MPTFDVIIQGKKYHVEIPDPGASPLQVVVDGEAFDVAVSGVGIHAQPQCAPAPQPAPQPAALPPMPKVAVARSSVPANELSGAGHEVLAPMPGTILSVAVKPGDVVEVGQVVCVLEAMKMKNPIRVSFNGTVGAVPVTAGQTVAYGDVLVRLA